MAFIAPGLYSRFRTMLPELLKFGIIGGLGTIIDLGGAAVLNSEYHVEPLAAKAVSVTLATVLTYLGSRFWTFKERENQSVHREAVLFIALNVVGLLIAEAVIGLVTYIMGLHGKLEYNAASFIGTGLGTIFRFWAYRRWVFLDPDKASKPTQLPGQPAVPDYPPWELASPSVVAAEATTQALARLAAPDYSSPREREPVPAWQAELTPASWGAPPLPAALSAPTLPAPTFPAPTADMQRPAPRTPKAPPTAPRPRSSGGRHRKS